MYTQIVKINKGENHEKHKRCNPWRCTHTHTHTHTPGVLVNKKIISIINTIKKDSKNLVLIDDT